VIVDKANEARCSDAFYQALTHKKSRREARKALVEVWKGADMDMDNIITHEELRTAFNEQESFRHYFRQMDIDLDFLEMAFEAVDNGSGKCNFEELANSVVQMKNTDIAPVVSVVRLQLNQVMKEMSNLSSQINSLQADLQGQAETSKDRFHRTEKTPTPHKSLTSSRMHDGSEYHVEGGGLLPAAMAEMMCCFGSISSPADVVEKKLERNNGTPMDESDRGISVDLHMSDDSNGRRDKGNKLRGFIDRRENTRWSRDYRSDGDGGGNGRGRSRQRDDWREGVMVAAAGGKELAQLQHQAQQVERDIRSLKAKLAADTGSKRLERHQDMKVLTEILADIRGKELKKKVEISAAMGTVRDVRESRIERARMARQRELRKECDF